MNLFFIDKSFIYKNKNNFYRLINYYNERYETLIYINSQESIKELSKFLSYRTPYPSNSTDLLEYPPYLVATADIIKRYNGGRYYKIEIKKEKDVYYSTWYIDRFESWIEKKKVNGEDSTIKHQNYYVNDISNINQ